jgi:serine/threonine protein kinase
MPKRIFAGKYEVQDEIAQGAMGIVYRALDQKLNRVVALKVVHPHLTSDTSFLQRFLREARAMARLQHENIVTIYSVEQDQGTQFMVMEYFPGTNLHGQLQPNTGLPLARVLAITCQIGKALSYAHAHGIIHRDIKPANVLVGPNDHVKLTDFGIAAALDEAPLTTAGQLIGTLLYMSPEQAKDAGLDGRSDLYSLGLMLYEMATGTHPRRGLSNAAVLGMLSNETAMPILSFPPQMPSDVQAVIKDLLRYRPVDRINDARQLIDRLELLQAGGRSVPGAAQQPNALVDDRTICELEEPRWGTVLPSLGKSNQPAEKRRPRPLGSGTIVAIVFGAIVVLALGFVGLNSFLSPSTSAPTPLATLRQSETNISDSNSGSIRPEPSTSVPHLTVTAPQVDLKDAQERLDRLRQSVMTKDLAELVKLSVMSEDRRSWVEGLFQNYGTIEASLGDIVTSPTGVSTVLRIEKLTLPNGEAFPIGPALQKIRLSVPREGTGWGMIYW